jgi:hypothetical protein
MKNKMISKIVYSVYMLIIEHLLPMLNLHKGEGKKTTQLLKEAAHENAQKTLTTFLIR